MKSKAVIFDIDGTLTDTSHRQHFMQGKKKDHKSFHDAAEDDPPIQPVVDLCKMHLRDYSFVFFVTGRPERIREQTLSWLSKHLGLPVLSLDSLLYMRKDKDHREDPVFKAEVYEKYIKPNYDVQFVVEDRTMCVEMWRDLGLVCLQCAPGNF